MTISPVSYSSYQNIYNIKSKNKSDAPKDSAVSFKGSKKVVTSKDTSETVKKNGGKILTALAALLGFAGKTSKERVLEKDFEEMTTMGGRYYSVKEQTPELYKPLLNAYSDNPQLVTELYRANIGMNCCDRYTSLGSYSNKDILFIYEINKVNPSLTPLAKKALGGMTTRFSSRNCIDTESVREKVRNAILNDPQKVEQAIKKIEETKEIHNDCSYEIYEDYYTLEELLKTLNE